ncbi:hypothetical protein [Deinococcus sonorensis]|uniref:Uncharacterized protein n=1 Tax=Deinococcus sonorensis TaxID=309891 RepID=A0ABV8YDW5_9DEIO
MWQALRDRGQLELLLPGPPAPERHPVMLLLLEQLVLHPARRAAPQPHAAGPPGAVAAGACSAAGRMAGGGAMTPSLRRAHVRFRRPPRPRRAAGPDLTVGRVHHGVTAAGHRYTVLLPTQRLACWRCEELSVLVTASDDRRWRDFQRWLRRVNAQAGRA